MKCTFRVWDVYWYHADETGLGYDDITVYKSSFELEYEINGYMFVFDHFLNTSYQHAYYVEV